MSEILLTKLNETVERTLAVVEKIADGPRSNFGDVGNFHRNFGLPFFGQHDKPTEIDEPSARFRLRFLAEELAEIAEGYGYEMEPITFKTNEVGPRPQSLPKIFDGLIDLVYVALGTAHLHGFPWGAGFAEVQRANMTKQRAAVDGSDSTRGSSLDVVKPIGWKPPDIAGVLARAGWPGPKLPMGGDK